MQRILIAFGTRPEAIKMAPVAKALQEHDRFEVEICLTGQHRELVEQVMQAFQLTADFTLHAMKPGQSLSQLTMQIMRQFEPVLDECRPDRVLVHGDTTSALTVAQCCYHNKIPVAHVEAGLRTGQRYDPWPEEMNRKLLASLADLHFAPTPAARQNLLEENVCSDRIYMTGNTIVDAIRWAAATAERDSTLRTKLQNSFPFLDRGFILVTSHRRENYGDGISKICEALQILADETDRQIVYPVHPNPNIRDLVSDKLSNRENIHLVDPLTYLEFVWMLSNCDLVLTDSGGVQEEAVTLNKPVLILRETTERPEVLQHPHAKLVGVEPEAIVYQTKEFLRDAAKHGEREGWPNDNPFGDGKSSQRIVDVLLGDRIRPAIYGEVADREPLLLKLSSAK